MSADYLFQTDKCYDCSYDTGDKVTWSWRRRLHDPECPCQGDPVRPSQRHLQALAAVEGPGQHWVWEAAGQADGAHLLPGGQDQQHAGQVLSHRPRARVHQRVLLVYSKEVRCSNCVKWWWPSLGCIIVYFLALETYYVNLWTNLSIFCEDWEMRSETTGGRMSWEKQLQFSRYIFHNIFFLPSRWNISAQLPTILKPRANFKIYSTIWGSV